MYSKSLILGAVLASMAFAGPQPTATENQGPSPTLKREEPIVQPPLRTGAPDPIPAQANNIFWATGLSRHPHQPEPTGRKHLFSEETLEKMYKKWCGICPSGQVCYPPSNVVRREVLDCMINKPIGIPTPPCPQAKGHCGLPTNGNNTLPSHPNGPPFHIMKPVENKLAEPGSNATATEPTEPVDPSNTDTPTDPTGTDTPTDPTGTDTPTTPETPSA